MKRRQWKSTEEEWVEYGLIHNYQKLMVSAVANNKSKRARRWYEAGRWRGWLDSFTFLSPYKWQTYEEWKDYGLKAKFNLSFPRELRRRNKESRSWYQKGAYRRWVSQFQFLRRGGRLEYITFKDWKEYGLKRRYQERTRVSLMFSETPAKRSWYSKGKRKKWLKKFKFRSGMSPFGKIGFKQWMRYGLNAHYDEKCRKDISTSTIETDKQWLGRGEYKEWLGKFPFKRKRGGAPYDYFNEWRVYGIAEGYDKRNPTSLKRSKDLEEKKWFNKGQAHGWTDEFPFAYLARKSKSLKKFIAGNKEAAAIVSIASQPEYAVEVVNILMRLWPESFPSAAQLAKSLPGAVKRIGYSLSPFTLETARDVYEKTRSLPNKARYSLDELLYSIAVEQYQLKFNQKPEEAMAELRVFARERGGISKLVRKVLKFYQEIYDFKIPGYGSLKEAA